MSAKLKTREGRLLSAALALLESRGWCKGHYQDNHGKFCASGAIHAAIRSPSGWYHNWLQTEDLVESALELKGINLATWNDRRSTTFHDVRRAFRKAIKLAEAHK